MSMNLVELTVNRANVHADGHVSAFMEFADA
jgi:hypothetical protein